MEISLQPGHRTGKDRAGKVCDHPELRRRLSDRLPH